MNAVAQDLGVKPEVVYEMEMRLNSSDASFDGHEEEDNEDAIRSAPAGFLADHRYNPAQQLETTNWLEQSGINLHSALTQLDARSQEILQSRWLNEEKATLQDLANKYQVSAERIRQLEKNAMVKLKAALLD